MLLFTLLFFCACDVEQDMGSLPELSKPYAGMYECNSLTLGGKDMLPRFDYVRLELKGSGEYLLSYRTAEGAEGGYQGNYVVDPERQEISLIAKTGARKQSFVFPMEKGIISVNYNLYGNLLHAELKIGKK